MNIKLKKRNIKILLLLVLLLLIFIVLNQSYSTSNELYNNIAIQHQDDDNLNYDVDNIEYIDSFQSLLVQKTSIYHKTNNGECLEKRHFVFIKTMKCATQTVVQILRRFGYLRHLNFVLPRQENIYLGWPFIMEKQDYRPSKLQFNALVEHSVYNHTILSELMPKGTDFITIIREPFSQFKSSFNYFNVANISFVKEADQLSGYLQNLEKYESFYKSREGARIRYCIPDGFSITKNLLSHCLGMPLGYPSTRANITADLSRITEYINQLDEDFTLVMIMEYFHESLVLLKRLMCWSMEDIVYYTRNVGNYAFKHSKPSEANLRIYKHWSHIDYLLYNHFNKTLWKKVHAEGEDFQKEVAEYNKIQSEISSFCSDKSTGETAIAIEESAYSKSFIVTKDFCVLLGLDLLQFLKKRFDREEGWIAPEVDKSVPKRCC